MFDWFANRPLQVASQKIKKKGANNCNHHKYGVWETRFKEENYFFTLTLKMTLTKGNYYRKTHLVTRSICITRLVTRSTSLTTRCACSTCLPARSSCSSIRSTCLSIRLSIDSTCLSTRIVCLFTYSTRSTIYRSFYN